ncbi:unnamed protein product [Symbiodinium sp. CCMP2592]
MKLAEKTARLLCWYLPDWVDGLSILNWLGTCREARLSQRGTSWPAKFQATVHFTKNVLAYMRKHHVMPSNEDYVDALLHLLHDDRLPVALPSPGGPLVIDTAHVGEYREHVAMYLGLRAGSIKGNSFKEFLAVVQKLNGPEHAWCRDPAFQSVRNKLVEGNARFFVRSECWDSLLHGSECTDSCDCIYLVFQYHNFYFALCTWPDIDNFL